MKKIYIYLSLTVLLFSSCEKYLDIIPKGQAVLTEVSQYYSIFDDDVTLHGKYGIYDALLTTDEFWPLDVNTIISNPNGKDAANFLWNEDIDRVSIALEDEFYNNTYKRISRYNIIIQEVMDSEGSEQDKITTLSEAKILRAFNHFMLVNYYANQYSSSTANETGVILIKDFNMEQDPKQYTVQEAYDFILQDINDAIPGLRSNTPSSFHPTSAFGYALLAKVQLFMGEFDKALESSTKSLEINNVVSDFIEIHNNGKPGPYGWEISFPFDAPDYLYYGGYFGMPLSQSISKDATYRFGTKDAYGKTGDIRLDDIYIDYGLFIPGNLAQVFYQVNFKHVGAGISVAEVRLMRAECLARTGDVDGALTIVNNLRKLRILPERYTELSASNKVEAVKVVIEERSRELLNTLNRFWDIRRLANEPDYAIDLHRTFDGKDYSITGKSHIFTMPFPRSLTDINKSVKQNTK